MDGNTAAIMCERESSDAAGAYPITPSTQMGEYWAMEAANGHLNVSGKPLIFIEPEGEHAAAAVTAGLSMTGLRSTNFSSGQGIAYMHESLYTAVGKRLTYVLNMGCRAMTKATLNVHAGHDDYHAVDDTGFFQVFAKNVQQVADLNIIAHRIAELALTPGIVGQDGFLTTHLIESLRVPERELIAEYLGRPDDIIDTPTPAQELMFGAKRRRIPELWDVDNPVMSGVVQNQDSYMQSVAAQRPFFFNHIEELALQAMEEFYRLTGRMYGLIETYRADDAEYLFVGQGSVIPNAEAVSDYLRQTRGIKVGVLNITMFRPFPGHYITKVLKGKKGVVVLERLDQPLAEDMPLMREIRAAISKSFENGKAWENKPYPNYESFASLDDVPVLYSSSYGMGSRDLQPEALIGAIENIMPGGQNKKMFYLSIDFIREKAYSKKQETYQNELLQKYPNIKEFSVRGSENPNLMPEGAITVRIHSIGGWGAMATGKNLTMTLSDILGYYIKSNPKYGSEKKGQPTTYYLAVAPEPIRVNCEFYYVDAVLSPDPNVFKNSNPLAGLKKGGLFIIQSDQKDPSLVWASIPKLYQKQIIDNDIKIYFIDAFKIAKEEATDPELQYRMQGMAFQGSFFAVSEQLRGKLSEDELFAKIKEQLLAKFGTKGERVVEDNLRVVYKGFHETRAITELKVSEERNGNGKAPEDIPFMLERIPANQSSKTDIHRFWEQTGQFYKTGKGNDIIADPFVGVSLIPAATGVFRDMTNIRFEHPQWVAERCTGCGTCWTMCPDSAIPGLVNEVSDIFESVIKRQEKMGNSMKYVTPLLQPLEEKVRAKIAKGLVTDSFHEHLKMGIKEITRESTLGETEKTELGKELDFFWNDIKDYQFSVTRAFYDRLEKQEKGSGGLLSITINPSTCKGCMECVSVCNDNALLHVQQTEESVATMKKNWDFWLDLPNTKQKFTRIDDLEEGIGALENLLLNKNNYMSMVGGDGACLGCAEKSVLHLFTSTVTALMQNKVAVHLQKIDELIFKLESKVRESLTPDLKDAGMLEKILSDVHHEKWTRSQISAEMEGEMGTVDSQKLKEIAHLIQDLKQIKWRYITGTTGTGRANLGLINSTGCSSVWGSTYPVNPYPFPWANNLFQDSPSLAMGIFEGHMSKMSQQFRTVRQAEMELGLRTREDLTYFTWKDFTDEEYHLSPPVVAVGGDGAMYDIGFQNLSRMMMSGKPIKVVILDTQVYSNTGGQACTSGFSGQVSDMASYGKIDHGKEELRKEIGLIGFAHRTSYIMQSSMATPSHMIEGFIEGLRSKRPAVFNIFCSCPAEHGVADDVTYQQTKLALESRTYPVFKFNPDKGEAVKDCFNLDGNPEIENLWPEYELKYRDERGVEKVMKIQMTFADYATTEGRFRKHFKKAPHDTWDDEKMVPLAEFLEMGEEEKVGKYPYIWALDAKKGLNRLLVSEEIVAATRDRGQFWKTLKFLAGLSETTVKEEKIREEIQVQMIQKFTSSLMQLANVGQIPVSMN
ncbi:MAG: 2-oxoacid:acceptor oxidoreductase family protein [Leptospiraceae bacterium]|nr:2-oxoacid:acceptor oxidoreductase family protein [Leptospiraceae bacterium]